MSSKSYTSAAKKASRLRLTKNKTLNTVIVAFLILCIGGAWYFLEYGGGITTEGQAPETGSSASDYSEWSTKDAFKEANGKVDSLTQLNKKEEKVKYNRKEQFGTAWKYDFDKSGCDTRDDILKVSMEAAEMKDKCKLAAGILRYDPYDGETNVKMTAADMGKELDGEHIVSLWDVWASGAQLWDSEGTPDVSDKTVSDDPYERRQQIANDPLNVIMADSSENRSKGEKDASQWIVPKNPEYACEYITRQVEVKAKYGLGVTDSERSAMKKTLSGCVK